MSGDDNQAGGDLRNSPWQLWVDGTALPNPGKMSIGLVLVTPDGQIHQTSQILGGTGCNNEAELHALIAGLKLARDAKALHLQVKSDSDFVVRHVKGEMLTRVERFQALLMEAQQRLTDFASVELLWIPRHRNGAADALARQALGLKSSPNKKQH
ncbi:MAG TPA: ribonuclease HI family protein [Rhodocyclaceae bacterium]